MGAFQWIFDVAETISIDKKPVVASTITRSNVIRSTLYSAPLWRFTVKVPDGLSWSTYRPSIEQSEALDRHTSSTIQINNAGYNSWFTTYRGNSVNYTGFAGSWTQGSTTLTLTTSPTTSSGYKFRTGDLIQLGLDGSTIGAGSVYTVASDVAYNSNTVTLNTAVKETTASAQSINVGPNVYWTIICQDFPNWTIFNSNQVSWSGPFVFYEVR